VGSNVVLANLPPDARISVVAEGNVLSREAVREKYGRFEHLRRRDLGAATWLVDVLEHVRRLAPRVGDTFTLPGFYESAEPSLSRLHPENRHVRDKMRQQLQVLRDRGVLAFEGRGVYRILSA
jgi:type II restriction enzyme